jgi:hypothetical protein
MASFFSFPAGFDRQGIHHKSTKLIDFRFHAVTNLRRPSFDATINRHPIGDPVIDSRLNLAWSYKSSYSGIKNEKGSVLTLPFSCSV